MVLSSDLDYPPQNDSTDEINDIERGPFDYEPFEFDDFSVEAMIQQDLNELRLKRLKVDNDPQQSIEPTKAIQPVSIEQILQLQTISKRKDSFRVILDGSSSLFVPKPALIQVCEFFESYFIFQEVSEVDVQRDEILSDDDNKEKSIDLSQVISPADCAAMQHLLSIAATSFIFSRPLSELPIPVGMSMSDLVKLLFLADRLQFSAQVYSYLSSILRKKLSDYKGLNIFLQCCYDEFQDQDIPIHQIVAFSHSFTGVSTSLKRISLEFPTSCLYCDARGRVSKVTNGFCGHCRRFTFCDDCFDTTGRFIQMDENVCCDICDGNSPCSVVPFLCEVKVFITLFPALWLSVAYKKKLCIDLVQFKKDTCLPSDSGLVDLIKPHLSEDLRKEIIPFLSMLCAVDVS